MTNRMTRILTTVAVCFAFVVIAFTVISVYNLGENIADLQVTQCEGMVKDRVPMTQDAIDACENMGVDVSTVNVTGEYEDSNYVGNPADEVPLDYEY